MFRSGCNSIVISLVDLALYESLLLVAVIYSNSPRLLLLLWLRLDMRLNRLRLVKLFLRLFVYDFI